MHSLLTPTLAALILAFTAQARDVPANVQTFYNSLKTKGSCSDKLATGFYSTYDGSNTFSYCNDHHADYNVIYIQGTGGAFANMDIDCDGAQGGPADDGRCGNSDDTQSITSFADTVKAYNKGINDLNANVHPYVVFGNSGSKAGYKTFNPQSYGIQPLSVMAVVCGNKLVSATTLPLPIQDISGTKDLTCPTKDLRNLGRRERRRRRQVHGGRGIHLPSDGLLRHQHHGQQRPRPGRRALHRLSRKRCRPRRRRGELGCQQLRVV
jgi:hypothetical protein